MSVEPIDIGAVAFKLVFYNTNKSYWIDPPIGWDSMPLELKREGKYERHISFADDKELEFWKHKPVDKGHRVDELVQHYNLFADESNIDLEIYVDDELFITANLDSTQVITDKESFYKTKILVKSLEKTLKDLEDTKIDVFGTVGLDGETVLPAEAKDVVLYPKKILERTTHVAGNEDRERITNVPIVNNFGQNDVVVGGGLVAMGNPYGLITVNESNVGSEYFVPTSQDYINAGPGNAIPDTYISGELNQMQNLYFDTPSDVTFRIVNAHFKVNGQNITESGTLIRLQAAIITYDNEDHDNVINKEYIVFHESNGKEVIINTEYSVQLPKYTRVIYEYRVYANGRVSTIEESVYIYGTAEITADTIDIYPPTNAKMTRLIQAGEKVISDCTKGEAVVVAPRFVDGGELWWYFVTSGSHVRGFTNFPFNLSYKEWKDFVINAFNCDVQVSDNIVFVGRHEDFYIDKEIERFEFKPDLDSYEVRVNQELVVNNVDLSFNKYESDKINTIDAFHTESEWHIPKRNKGELGIEIPFIADGYSLEYARREGIESEPTTAKDIDEDVYIVDTIEKTIHIPIINIYVTITHNRQNQGFPIVQNVFSPETIYNLRLSQKRILLDHYPHRLAEIGQKLNNGIPTTSTVFLRNTRFKNNGDLKTKTDGSIVTYPELITENENVTPQNLKEPLISPEIYSFTLAKRLKFDELMRLYKRVVNERGYITMYTDDAEIKLYPYEMSYDWVKESLTMTAERKYAI